MSNITETTVPGQTAATRLLVQLRTILQEIRGFGLLGAGTRRGLVTWASLPDTFLLAVAAALEALPTLAAASRTTAARLREVVAFSNAFLPMAAELRLMARDIENAVATQRAEAGKNALKTYNAARSFDPPDHELFVPHLENMRTTLGRGRPKSTALRAA